MNPTILMVIHPGFLNQVPTIALNPVKAYAPVKPLYTDTPVDPITPTHLQAQENHKNTGIGSLKSRPSTESKL